MFSMSDIVYVHIPRPKTHDGDGMDGALSLTLFYRGMGSVEFFISKVLISTPNLRNEFLDVVYLKTVRTVMT